MTEENVVYGLRPTFQPPPISLGEFLFSKIREAPRDDIAQESTETGCSQTFSEMLGKSIMLAEQLRSLGIRPKDVIAITSENNLDFGVCALAAFLIGAIVAPYNHHYVIHELLHTMSITQPRLVFASSATIENVLNASKELRCVRDVVLIGDGRAPPNVSGFINFTDLLRPTLQTGNVFVPSRVDPKETALVLSSSGTTGLPKGVELTHQNVLYLLCFLEKQALDEPERGQVIPGFLPFYHGYGFALLFGGIVQKLKLAVMPRFNEETFLRTVQDNKVTRLFLVPPLVVFLGKHPMVDKYDLRHVKTIVSGAAPLSKEDQDRVTQRLGIRDIRQGYGMTETTVVCTYCTETANKIGSSGRVADGMMCKIADPETGKALPRNQRGEICFKGPFIMKCYMNNPNATAETIDKDGWLHTGDIGYIDDEEYIFVVDRIKELIKYKGFQVAPAELEAILFTNPGVRDAGVVGLPDPEAGEVPLAFVVLQPGAKLTEQELKDYVAKRVSPQKRLRGGVRFVSEIPRNPSGKILRRILRSKI